MRALNDAILNQGYQHPKRRRLTPRPTHATRLAIGFACFLKMGEYLL